jgi:hypothetical protein
MLIGFWARRQGFFNKHATTEPLKHVDPAIILFYVLPWEGTQLPVNAMVRHSEVLSKFDVVAVDSSAPGTCYGQLRVWCLTRHT